MHWTEWQSFGLGEWAVALFGIAATLWLVYLIWLFVAALIRSALKMSGRTEAAQRFWRWYLRVTPGG
jgi:hypothetical protein